MNTLRLFGGLGTLLAAALLSVASIWLPDGLAAAATDTDPWVFVSSPDWFNTDIADLSGSSPPIPAAPGWASGASGGINGVTPQMQAVYSQLVGEMAACGPCAFLVAGDLINGRWFTPETLDMFAPGSRNRVEAIDTAAAIYYRWYLGMFEERGVTPVIAAPGDHELGDDPWPVGTEVAAHVDTMKRAFVRELLDPINVPEPFPGIPSSPPETDGFFASFAIRIQNVLIVSIDMFDGLAAGESLDPWTGTIRMRVDGSHLAWVAQILAAADADSSLDHVIVQGHLPIIDPVRMRNTSGLMLAGREDSPLWQLMRQHDQRNGGKVRLYFAGEVHAPTVVQDPAGDIVQIVHGNPPRYTANSPGGNYLVFTIRPTRIEVELRRFELYDDGSNLFWQPGTFSGALVTPGPSGTSGGRTEGYLTIDTGGPAASLNGSGWLTPIPFPGLVVNYQFDELTLDGKYSNSGAFQDLYYAGEPAGAARTGTGKFGDGLVLDGNDAFVKSGRGQLIEGETRTVGAWVKLTAGGVNTILGYGGRKSGVNGRFLFRVDNGRLELDIAPYTVCVPASAPTVSDGQWHHVAVVLPNEHDNRCSDLRFYVDGNGAFVGTGQAALRTLPWSDYRIGVDERSSSGFFDGVIDDLAIWHAPLSTGQVRGLVEAGNHPELEFDALAMQSLYSLYYRQSGTENLGGREWRFVSELAGVPGDVMGSGDDFAIQFDGLGNGVGTGDDFLPDAYVDGEIFEPTGTVDLSAEGTADWIHVGLSNAASLNRKAGVLTQIGSPVALGGSAGRFDSSARLAYRWDDGTPVSAASTTSGLYASGVGRGFQVTVPADDSSREAVVYVGGSHAEGRLEASLGDQAAAPFVADMSDSDDVFDRRVKIAYRTTTASALTLRYTMIGGTGNVTLSAVTLQGESINRAPVIDPLDARLVTAGESLAVSVVARDPDGPPPLILAATGVPAGAQFTDLGNGDGLFSWVPGIADIRSVPYEVLIEASDGTGAVNTATLLITVVDAAAPFVQDGVTGIVSIEAEHYDGNTDRGGHMWVPSSQSGASGSASLVTTPNDSINRNVGYETDSPRLDYRVNFLQPGTYSVWLRGLGPSSKDDSAHFGVNGTGPPTADRISSFPTWWRWSNQTMDGVSATITIPAVGEYTLNLWMKEDGFIVDKIVLAPAASGYNPTADGSYGPPESLRGTP